MTLGPLEHGVQGYKRGCRCLRCKSAYNAKVNARRRAKAPIKLLPVESAVYRIQRLHQAGIAYAEMVKQWGVSKSTIYDLATDTSRKRQKISVEVYDKIMGSDWT